jgi:hypothetical protein
MRGVFAICTLLLGIAANSSTPNACEHLVEGRLYFAPAGTRPTPFTHSDQCLPIGPTILTIKLPKHFIESGTDCARMGGRLAVIVKRPSLEIAEALRRDEEEIILSSTEPEKFVKRRRVLLAKDYLAPMSKVSVADYQAFHMHSSGGPPNLIEDLKDWHNVDYIPCQAAATEPWTLKWIQNKLMALWSPASLTTYSDCKVRARLSLVPNMNGCQTDSDVARRRAEIFGERNDCARFTRLAAACEARPNKDDTALVFAQLLSYSVDKNTGAACVQFSIPKDMCVAGNSAEIVELFPGVTQYKLTVPLN